MANALANGLFCSPALLKKSKRQPGICVKGGPRTANSATTAMIIWLVVYLPLPKIWLRQLGSWHSQLFLDSHNPFDGSSHHQPGIMMIEFIIWQVVDSWSIYWKNVMSKFQIWDSPCLMVDSTIKKKNNNPPRKSKEHVAVDPNAHLRLCHSASCQCHIIEDVANIACCFSIPAAACQMQI